MGIKNYPVHRGMDRHAFKRVIGYSLVLGIFFVLVLLYIRQTLIKVQIENEITSQIQVRNKLMQQNQELKLERGVLKDHSRIQQEAFDRLGLINPSFDQLFFSPGDSWLEQ